MERSANDVERFHNRRAVLSRRGNFNRTAGYRGKDLTDLFGPVLISVNTRYFCQGYMTSSWIPTAAGYDPAIKRLKSNRFVAAINLVFPMTAERCSFDSTPCRNAITDRFREGHWLTGTRGLVTMNSEGFRKGRYRRSRPISTFFKNF